VLFVHGAMNGGASWAPLIARLPGFHCVALDRPGCGLSDARREPLEDLAALGELADTLIVDVLDAMGLDRVHVAGTSYGGYIALRSAAAHPDRVVRMMQYSWPAGACRLPFSLRVSGARPAGRLMAAMPITTRSVRSLLRRIGLKRAVDTGTFTPVLLDWYVALLRDTETLKNEIQAGPRFPVWKMDDRMMLPASLLATIHTPMHFFWGEEDPFGDAAVAHEFLQLLPDAELELVREAGHAPWIDHPDAAAAATRGFLAS
jgi:pimeloyl-ACP methyl ester carboxylesterase